jgi:hypothetical protein
MLKPIGGGLTLLKVNLLVVRFNLSTTLLDEGVATTYIFIRCAGKVEGSAIYKK